MATKHQRAVIKHCAQDRMMRGLQIAMSTCEDDDAIKTEMERLFRRIEKQFGYVPGSWSRGV